MTKPLRAEYQLGGDPRPERLCDHPQCDLAGEFRAPKSRESLRDYFWFCLDHVRLYNAQWNYCEGMDTQTIDDMAWDDACWQRPTWPMGTKSEYQKGAHAFQDDIGLFDDLHQRKRQGRKKAAPRTPPHPYMEALEILDLSEPLTMQQLKIRYKELVKIHHPDLNGGDDEAEERLKQINQAYAVLKKNLMQKPGESAM
ncbi:J domain-containing protein [Aestuariispira insulae]|uniref:DnaJ-like protein n=1 Tax=Aestuariispira insulae TaxID=1461337 RepID=A0A3D9HP44_9PROT|nr:J domain-containing protein [Aestuariispira insulae]RED51239.1 DnaJ-like protein [Aestuariispira insulae]